MFKNCTRETEDKIRNGISKALWILFYGSILLAVVILLIAYPLKLLGAVLGVIACAITAIGFVWLVDPDMYFCNDEEKGDEDEITFG
jgi:hypothetical protein